LSRSFHWDLESRCGRDLKDIWLERAIRMVDGGSIEAGQSKIDVEASVTWTRLINCDGIDSFRSWMVNDPDVGWWVWRDGRSAGRFGGKISWRIPIPIPIPIVDARCSEVKISQPWGRPRPRSRSHSSYLSPSSSLKAYLSLFRGLSIFPLGSLSISLILPHFTLFDFSRAPRSDQIRSR
jgi:hypothetical protein